MIREVDGILHSWLNDVMFQDGFQDVLRQPLVDGTLLIMTISYVEVYQVVLDIMLSQGLKSILNDVFNNFPIILLPTIVMVQLSCVLLKVLIQRMGRMMMINAILFAEICNTKHTSILKKQYPQTVYLCLPFNHLPCLCASLMRGEHVTAVIMTRIGIRKGEGVPMMYCSTVLDLDGVLSGPGSTEEWGLEMTKLHASGNT